MGSDATVWYRDILQYSDAVTAPLLPLYFFNKRKQLFCLRNCFFQSSVEKLVAILREVPALQVYKYSGSEGETFAIHLEGGIFEQSVHAPRYDYNGTGQAMSRMSVKDMPAAVFASIQQTDSRKQYTSILFRVRDGDWMSAHHRLVADIGAIVTGAYPSHILVVSYLVNDTTKLYKLPGMFTMGKIVVDKHGWSRMVVAPDHQEFVHPDMVVKTITSKGDCMYSALAYALAKMWQTEADAIARYPRLASMYVELAACKTLEQSIVFMRNFINKGLTPEFLCRHFCDGDWNSYRSFVEDGTILESGLIDPEADSRFKRSLLKSPPSGYLDAIRAYKNTNAYWGRDFDLQLLEMQIGVGVVVFASRGFFGSTVDMFGRKPNSAYPFYVTLYNQGNFHFEVAGQGEQHVCGYSSARLPVWLRYLLEIGLCATLD